MRRFARCLVGFLLTACGGGVSDTPSETIPDAAPQGPRVPDVALVSADFFCDCMPVVGPDSVSGRMTMRYRAAANPVEWRIKEARYRFDRSPDDDAIWTLDVTPPGSGALTPGEVLTVTHRTVGTTARGDHPCTGGGKTWSLELTLEGPKGEETFKTAPQGYACTQ